MEKRVYVHDGTQFNLADRRRLLYYNWLAVLELDVDSQGANTTRRKYTWGLDLGGAGVSPAIDSAAGIGGLLATRDVPNSTRYIYFHDANGNVSQLIDRSAGTLAAAYVYDAYGNTVYQTGPLAAENPIRFSTKYYDAELDDATTSDVSEGLYYYGYRYYSPWLGRWLSRDPITEVGGMILRATATRAVLLRGPRETDPHLSRFVWNTATNLVDPLGLQAAGTGIRKRYSNCMANCESISVVGYWRPNSLRGLVFSRVEND